MFRGARLADVLVRGTLVFVVSSMGCSLVVI